MFAIYSSKGYIHEDERGVYWCNEAKDCDDYLITFKTKREAETKIKEIKDKDIDTWKWLQSLEAQEIEV